MLAKTIKYFRSQCSPYQIISDIDLPFLDCNYRNTRNHLLSDYANKLLEDTSKGIHKKKNLISSVNAFKIEINSNPILKINFQEALANIENGQPLYNCKNQEVFQMLSHLCMTPPHFDRNTKTELPFFNLFLSLLQNRFGQHFFSKDTVNEHFKSIIHDYQTLLYSENSLSSLNEMVDYSIEKQQNQYFGLNQDINIECYNCDNWVKWYSRPLYQQLTFWRDSNVVFHGAEGYPLNFQILNKSNQNKKGDEEIQGIQKTMLQLNEIFQSKNTKVNNIIQNHFNRGTYYLSYFDPLGYHRWHSPVSGKIAYTFRINSQYNIDQANLLAPNKGLNTNNLREMMIKKSATRHIVIIELATHPQHYVGVVAIGNSVSSLVSQVIEGETVQQGDELGYFQFGSYSVGLIFDKNLKLSFNSQIYTNTLQTLPFALPKKQKPNTPLASFH